MAKGKQPFNICFLIHDVSRLRRAVVDNALRPMGVTRSQWWGLANLSRHNRKGMMQTELAKVMGVGKVTLGGILDRLEASGLVKRQADPTDRRAKCVVMTPKGIKLLADIQEIATEVNAKIMNGILRNDISRAETVLYKMKQQLIAMDAAPGGGGKRDETRRSPGTAKGGRPNCVGTGTKSRGVGPGASDIAPSITQIEPVTIAANVAHS